MGLSISLVCAVAASLALGVLVAYGICLSMFHFFRIHARKVAIRKAAAPLASVTARILNS